jgi:hypothetical protein
VREMARGMPNPPSQGTPDADKFVQERVALADIPLSHPRTSVEASSEWRWLVLNGETDIDAILLLGFYTNDNPHPNTDWEIGS